MIPGGGYRIEKTDDHKNDGDELGLSFVMRSLRPLLIGF